MLTTLKQILLTLYSFLKEKRVIVLFLAVVLWIGWTLVMGDNGLRVRLNLELENRELKTALKRETEIQDSLRKEIKLLQTDKKRIEKAAREKYGMVKPGETLYKVQVSEDQD
ncbi:MAG: septum formation initiator family protein [Bacteroidetes bacterium]|nr:septum formation initiator family protein [Bacteroidota bacterium]